MKRLLSALAAAVLVPFSASAISVSDITDNPDQYAKLHEDADFVTYIDLNSIESLRYSPPYYTIKGNTYGVSYNRDMILGYTITVDYDYNRRFKAVMARHIIENNNSQSKLSNEQLIEKIKSDYESNTGMKASVKNLTFWHLDGTLRGTRPDENNMALVPQTRNFDVADYMFYRYYNENLYPFEHFN